MTTPAAPWLPVVAGLDVVATTARAEARQRHAIYRTHVENARHCACATGGICPRGTRLRDEADAADERWERAERLARRAAVRP